MRKLVIYLDSSDYSVLSDQKRLTPELSDVLKQLRQWKTDEVASYYFSGTHLSEMAPLESSYTEAAQRRADLLVELCGTNTLISQDRLFTSELRYALDLEPSLVNPLSLKGDWYPEGIAHISPVGQIQMAEYIDEAIGDLGLNRKTRRLAKRKSLKAGKPRATWMPSIIDEARNGSLKEILEKYPMRPEDARILGRFVVGDVTQEQASNAFLASLRDPRWMMKWFAQHHSKLTPFIEWTRAPSASIVTSLAEISAFVAAIHQQDRENGTTMAKDMNLPTQWLSQQDCLLKRIAILFAKNLTGADAEALSIHILEERCPGLSVCIRSLHSAYASTLGKTPRTPKLSDFPDALHSVYAPYTDIFRADSFMAPYITKAACGTNTKVVAKLVQLPDAIRSILAANH